MKVLIVTMGPGETSQGLAVGKYLASKGDKVSFVVLQKEVLSFVGDLFEAEYIVDPEEVKKRIDKNKYDFVLLCNSKMFRESKNFQSESPLNKPFVASLDSNWLFDQPDKYPYVGWADQIFLNFPEQVYENGLRENGGNFFINDDVKEKIFNVGLIPSYDVPSQESIEKVRKELEIKAGQKLIFAYIGSGTTSRKDFYDKCIAVFDGVSEADDKIKILFVQYSGPQKNWLLPQSKDSLSSDKFYNYLAAADLVFQHQGLGTLEQAISASVPVIANVNKPDPTEICNAHAWEVTPFEKAGLCKMHYFTDDNSDIIKSIEGLLYSDAGANMAKEQRANHSKGEEKIYEKIRGIIA